MENLKEGSDDELQGEEDNIGTVGKKLKYDDEDQESD